MDKFTKVLQRLFDSITGVKNNLAEQIIKTNLNFIDNTINPKPKKIKQEISGSKIDKIVTDTVKKDPLINPFGNVVDPDVAEGVVKTNNPFGQPVNPDDAGDVITDQKVEKENTQKGFTYKGITIDTEFVLGNEQIQALEKSIKHVTEEQDEVSFTIQGSAGTGKTSIIGLLHNWLEASRSNTEIVYMSPTHAANVQLANANLKNGIKEYPHTVQSSLIKNYSTGEYNLSGKVIPKFKRPIYVIDESSMLDEETVQEFKSAVEGLGGKIIFLGDTAQIPSPSNATRKLSTVFLTKSKVVLNKVYRQSPNTLLKVLTKIRNNSKFKTYKVENGDESLQFKNNADFYQGMLRDFKNNPEGTVYIAYTNQAVQELNTAIKEQLTGTTNIRLGDKLVGFAGAQSKSPSKDSIANAINYIVEDVTPIKRNNAMVLKIKATSKTLTNIVEKGVRGIIPDVEIAYFQLSESDSITSEFVTSEHFEANNQLLSEEVEVYFKDMLRAKTEAIKGNKSRWRDYYENQKAISEFFVSVDLGGKYVFNIQTDKFEAYDFNKHNSLYGKNLGDMTIDKGLDYGYGITAHKSQGMTIDNVYVDVKNIAEAGKDQSIFGENNEVVNSEKNTLYYVAMSRASKKTVINETGITFDETINDGINPSELLPLSENPLMVNPELLMPDNIKPCR